MNHPNAFKLYRAPQLHTDQPHINSSVDTTRRDSLKTTNKAKTE